MTANLFETTIGAFEGRMALRRKMLRVTGAQFPEHQPLSDVSDEFRSSVINCFECNNGAACTDWLATATEGAMPPEFCPNRETILRLRNFG